MSFDDFVHKNNLKNEATSKIKKQQVLGANALDDFGIQVRDGPFSADNGIVTLHPSEGTHWVAYINKNYFDCYSCGPPNKVTKCNIKRNGFCLFSEYKIQGLTSKRNSFCAIYCLYKLCLTKILGIDSNLLF